MSCKSVLSPGLPLPTVPTLASSSPFSAIHRAPSAALEGGTLHNRNHRKKQLRRVVSISVCSIYRYTCDISCYIYKYRYSIFMCVYHYSVCISADSLPMFAAVSFYGSGDMEPFPEEQHDCPAAFTKLLQTGELDWPRCAGFKTAPRRKTKCQTSL